MNQARHTDQYSLIVGMGATGLSIARYLQSLGRNFHFYDTRSGALVAEQLADWFPRAKLFFADIDDEMIAGADELLLSPGVSRDEPAVVKALAQGIPVIGDIALFLKAVDKPVVGITGSNGKSTVTTMVGIAAQKAGLDVGVGGNIGTPALNLLQHPHDLYVIELSSFQLESTFDPSLDVACILNISPDHMDRYASLAEYTEAKQRIYVGAESVVYSLDDHLTKPRSATAADRFVFGLEEQGEPGQDFGERSGANACFGYSDESGYLTHGTRKLIHKDEIKIKGLHNIKNALALFAIAQALNIDEVVCKKVLQSFKGLSHRCEWVDKKNDITFINDSKATNIGAAAAAIEGLAPEFSGITLIAGGDGKGANFCELAESINQQVRVLVLIGVDRQRIAENIREGVEIYFAVDMTEAVNIAYQCSRVDELVLLSPACASFDMFTSFEERGNAFVSAVQGIDA